MPCMMEKSLIDYLKEIPDHRSPHGLRHPLWLVLLIIIMGMMSGYWGYRQLGRFVERHRTELISRLKIPFARVPSYSAIRRVMINLDYEELQIVFNQWSKQYSMIPSSEWISLDGKSLKNTVTDYDQAQQNFINCVSAFSHQRGLVLGLKMMENKQESEINVVRDLIELLDLTGVVFTFDALHCQKKTLAAVVDSGNDYLVKVKRNQPKLYQQIERGSNRQTPRQKVNHYEKTRNRKTNRIIEVFEPPENLDPKWIGAGCVIKVSRSGTRGNEPFKTISYYISSCITSISSFDGWN